MARVRSTTLAVLPVLALGCASEAPAPTPSVTRDTLADGTTVVRYADLPADAAVRVEADLRIGAGEGDPNLLFGDVRSVEAGADGTIYVLDYQAVEIRAFDRNGRFLRTVSSRGEGPGEISQANGMILLGDSVLWVQDHAKWRMIALRPEGGEIARFPMHVLSYGYVWNGTVDERGRFWKPASHSDQRRPNPPEEGLTEGSVRTYLISYDPRTDARDSVFLGEERYRTHVSRNARGGHSYRGIPFDARPITIVDPAGGFWRTGAGVYRIARLDERGDTVLVVEAGVAPLPVTEEDRSRYVAEAVARRPEDRRAVEAVAALMPDTKPAIAKLVSDDAGRVWVERVAAEGEGPLFDVFRRDGEYEGSVRLAFRPSPYLPIRIRHGEVYALVLDSLDVPTVVRGRVPRVASR